MNRLKLAAAPAALTILTLAAGITTGSANAATPVAAKSSLHAAGKQAHKAHRASVKKGKKAKAHRGTKKAASGPTKIAVSGSFTDPVFGDKVTVGGLVRNFPVPAKYKAGYDNAELDLVQVTITAGSKFSTGFPVTGLYVIPANHQQGPDVTDIMSTKMTAAGFKAINDDGPDPGQTLSGWAAFQVYQKNSPTLTLGYERDAATVIGSNQSIPAKSFDIPLVSAKG